MEALLIRPRDERQLGVLASLFDEMGVVFEKAGSKEAPAQSTRTPLEALESAFGLLRDEIDDEQLAEMLREAHR